jgi:hypothetical protein
MEEGNHMGSEKNKFKPNPYLPEHVVDPPFFAGREDEIKTFRNFVEQGIASKPRNIAVTGEWGIGKTSLLRKLERIARRDYETLCIRVEMNSSIGFEDLLNIILISLKEEALTASGISDKTMNFFEDLNVSFEYGIKIEKKKINTPLVYEFRKKLVKIHDELKNDKKLIIISIDNAEFLEDVKAAVEETRNTFQRLAEADCKYMLIFSGRLTFFEEITAIYAPFARFFNLVELKPLNMEETKDAILLPIKNCNGITFTKDAMETIYEKSEGHPFIIKSMCSTLFDSVKGNGIITKEVIEKNKSKILKDLASKVFLDKISKASNEEKYMLIKMAKIADPLLSFKADKKTQEKLEILVNKILSLTKTLNEGNIRDTERGQKTIDMIKGIDKEIDELVYKIYDITEKEKRIIQDTCL